MSDPHGEPSSPRPQQSRALSTGEPEHLAPAPRVHPPSVHHPKHAPPEEEETAINVNEALELIRKLEAAASAQAAAQVAEEQQNSVGRPLIPKEQKKFHKAGAEQVKSAPVAPRPQPVPSSATPELTASPAGEFYVNAARGITAEQIGFIRQLQARDQTVHRRWLMLGVPLVLLLLGVAFLAGRTLRLSTFLPATASAGTSVPSRAKPDPGGSSANNLIDQAMASESKHDNAQAIEYLEGAQRAAGHAPGVSYHLAGLYQQAHQSSRALTQLNRSLADDEEVAASHHLRGLILDGLGETESALDDLEKATQVDPFNAGYLYDWAEAMRRNGDTTDALTQLQRASDRPNEPKTQELYALKVRLTQLELGQEAALLPKWEDEIQRSPRSPEWMLTAAAVKMRQGDFPEAATVLSQLRDLVGEDQVASLLRDPYLARFAHNKDLLMFYHWSAEPSRTASRPH